MTTEQKYKVIKKRLEINDAQVAEMFGYKNAMSFSNSKEGKAKVIAGIVSLFEKIAETQKDFWFFDEYHTMSSSKQPPNRSIVFHIF